jgi:hypothetical protein
MKWTKLSALLMEFSATGTIIDNNNAPTVATITLLRLPKDAGIDFTLSNPSAVDTSYFCSNKWYGSATIITDDSNCSC